MTTELPKAGAVPAPTTREEAMEGLRILLEEAEANERKKDPSFVRWPDMHALIDHIDAHGFPPPGKIQPHRRYEITVKCGGDTKLDASAIFQDFSADISEGKTGCARGVPSAGGHFDVMEYPEMTHEKYVADYLEP